MQSRVYPHPATIYITYQSKFHEREARMATARERVSRVVPTDIELVASEAPQYVNEEGFEVDAQTFAAALLKVSADLETQQEKGLGQAIDMEASGIESFDNIIAEADPLTGVSDLENVTANAEPLLSLAERYVLVIGQSVGI